MQKSWRKQEYMTNDIELCAETLARWKLSPLLFVAEVFSLTRQGVKAEYIPQILELELASWENWEILKNNVRPEWFGDWNEEEKCWIWVDFQKGKHLTWQQWLVLLGVTKAAQNKAPRHISVSSGHGIGKSATSSLITLWFLYCHHNAQVPCTAPTAPQMHDVLWKELSLWIAKMPQAMAVQFVWQTDYIRMVSNPETWFARARTSTKENTEAIAGVHSEHVMIEVDEASGVPEQVYNTAEGALTSSNVYIILFSNPTRKEGYFYDTHHRYKSDWQTFVFSSEESPIVDKEYVARIEKRHGRASEEFGIRVLGKFPGEGVMDDTGYLQLIPLERIVVVPYIAGYEPFIGRKILGIDPSGEGKDKATYVVRDRFHARCVHSELTTNPRLIAMKALQLAERYDIKPEDIVIGSLGVGTDIGKEIALSTQGRWDVYTVLEGNQPSYEEEYNPQFFERLENERDENGKDLYLNLRALMYFRLKTWLLAGGTLIDPNPADSTLKIEIVSQKYKRSMQGNKIQLMSKKEMLKLRIKSTNEADGLALTMLRTIEGSSSTEKEEDTEGYDPHEPV